MSHVTDASTELHEENVYLALYVLYVNYDIRMCLWNVYL